MDRRAFLRRASLVAAGTVAADQLDILDRLGCVRSLFPGFGAWPVAFNPPTPTDTLSYIGEPHHVSIATTSADLDAMFREAYIPAYVAYFKSQLAGMDAFNRVMQKPMQGGRILNPYTYRG
jgi:hypothetical protein